MHDEAESGIAAHWAYEILKNTKNYQERKASFANKKELQWINQLKKWQDKFASPEEFLESLKIDIFKDRIFVITPKGEVVDLPAGSTPIDFAYQIHSDVGNSCTGAKINGKIVSLDHQLRSGDIVEIHTQKNKKPSESWLEFVRTNSAKSHIKSSLKDSGKKLSVPTVKGSEMKIAVEDKLGLLKEILTVFSRNHVNIISVNTISNARFPILKIKCELTTRENIKKLILKLKAIKSIKEISYVFF